MLCAHLDVVPVDEKHWTHPPFDGFTDETYVWGRGALDNKHNVMVSVYYGLKGRTFEETISTFLI